MDTILEALSRPVLLYVTKDGTLTHFTRNARLRKHEEDRGLPVFSVMTSAQAEAIQVHFCRRQNAPLPGTFNQAWYRLSRLADGSDIARRDPPVLQIADLDGITRMFNTFYQERVCKRCGVLMLHGSMRDYYSSNLHRCGSCGLNV